MRLEKFRNWWLWFLAAREAQKLDAVRKRSLQQIYRAGNIHLLRDAGLDVDVTSEKCWKNYLS